MVTAGPKDVENRTWRRPALGRFFVHASKAMTRREYDEAVEFAAEEHPGIEVPAPSDLEYGGIVGVATHVGEPLGDDRVLGLRRWHMGGQFGYVLEERRALPFVECKGSLGLWRVPAEVASAVTAEVVSAAISRTVG